MTRIEFERTNPAFAFSQPGKFYTSHGGRKETVAQLNGFETLDLGGVASDLLKQAEARYDELKGHGVIVSGAPVDYAARVLAEKVLAVAHFITERTIISDALWVVTLPDSGQKYSINKPTTPEEAEKLTEFLGEMSMCGAELSTFTLLAAVDPASGLENLEWYSTETQLDSIRSDLDMGSVEQILRGNGHIAGGFHVRGALETLADTRSVRISYRRLDYSLQVTEDGVDVEIEASPDNMAALDALCLGFIR